MRELITFACEGSTLAGSLDQAKGTTGLLIVTGGMQTRIGSHRVFERLAMALAATGYPCLRFDRRGVGDSEGDDPGFRGSQTDIAAPSAAFRARVPALERIIGFGLCDGATALMLFGGAAHLDALILVNPWLVEAEPDQPPPAAIRRRYREKLTSIAGWRQLLSGRVSFRKLAGGLYRAANPRASGLAEEAIAALTSSALPVRLILARSDATAIAAEAAWRGSAPPKPTFIETGSHTFAKPGDLDALKAAVLDALQQLNSAQQRA